MIDIQKLKNHPKFPVHIAIIMDGNGRWAKSHGKARFYGHIEGVNSVRDIIAASTEINLKHLTLYTFSTENWNRPETETSSLMKLLILTIKKELRNLIKQNVKVNMIGCKKNLPTDVENAMHYAMEKTQGNTGLQLNIALNYSSRMELIEAIGKISKKIKSNEISLYEINEKLVSSHLYTNGIPDPDLLIRTSGEFRLSNFLLWQIAYSELYITQSLWPEFRKKEFFNAIDSYLNRERRFGLVSEQLK